LCGQRPSSVAVVASSALVRPYTRTEMPVNIEREEALFCMKYYYTTLLLQIVYYYSGGGGEERQNIGRYVNSQLAFMWVFHD
jgi:hypothetical protein